MLGRYLDDSYAPEVRRNITTVALSRLGANAVYRFSAPFLPTIASGLDVSLSRLGAAIAISEAVGLTAPLVGRRIDRRHHPTTMALGLVGVTAGALVAAAGPNIVWFVVGLVLLAVAKIVFDVALGAWTASHVPYERRGRVVGLVETSWALGMLVGVSTMGLVTALTSWRWGYVAGAVMTTAAVAAVVVRLGSEPRSVPAAYTPDALDEPHGPGGIGRRGMWMVAAMFALTAAAQSLFFTFGAWLEDEFGFGAVALTAVTFGLGGLELVASTTSAARVDRWGKERSVVIGAGLMVPMGLALAAFGTSFVPGVLALGVFIALFEFSIVSSISIGSELVPGAPARGLSAVIAAATMGRAAAATPATWLYEQHGIWVPALIGAAFASLTVLCITRVAALPARQSAVATPRPPGDHSVSR